MSTQERIKRSQIRFEMINLEVRLEVEVESELQKGRHIFKKVCKSEKECERPYVSSLIGYFPVESNFFEMRERGKVWDPTRSR